MNQNREAIFWHTMQAQRALENEIKKLFSFILNARHLKEGGNYNRIQVMAIDETVA